MQHSQGTFKGAGELDLYYQRWSPLCQRRAILIIVHGLGGTAATSTTWCNSLFPRATRFTGLIYAVMGDRLVSAAISIPGLSSEKI